MAVQSPQPTNAFSPNSRCRNDLIEEFPTLPVMDDRTIISGSKKRRRDEEPSAIMALPNQSFYNFPVQFRPHQPSRRFDSTGSSTSGRRLLSSSLDALQQNVDIDAVIRLHNEEFRLELEQLHKRHCHSLCHSLVSILGKDVIVLLEKKEMELEIANQKNVELEEKIRQLIADNQMWFQSAKENEAVASGLKATLEHVLDRRSATNSYAIGKEGYGDSDGEPLPEEAMQSCCFGGDDAVGKIAVTAAGPKQNKVDPVSPCLLRRECEDWDLLDQSNFFL